MLNIGDGGGGAGAMLDLREGADAVGWGPMDQGEDAFGGGGHPGGGGIVGAHMVAGLLDMANLRIDLIEGADAVVGGPVDLGEDAVGGGAHPGGGAIVGAHMVGAGMLDPGFHIPPNIRSGT